MKDFSQFLKPKKDFSEFLKPKEEPGFVDRFKDGYKEHQKYGEELVKQGIKETVESGVKVKENFQKPKPKERGTLLERLKGASSKKEETKELIKDTYKTTKGLWRGTTGVIQGTVGALNVGAINALMPLVKKTLKNTYEAQTMDGVSIKDAVDATPDIVKESLKYGGKRGAESTLMVANDVWNLLPKKAQEEVKDLGMLTVNSLDVLDLEGMGALSEFTAEILTKYGVKSIKNGKLLREGIEAGIKNAPKLADDTINIIGNSGRRLKVNVGGIASGTGDIAKNIGGESLSKSTSLSRGTINTIRETPDLFELGQKGQITGKTVGEEVLDAVSEYADYKGEVGKYYDALRKNTDTFTIPKNEIPNLIENKGLKVVDGVVQEKGLLSTNLSEADINAVKKAYKLVSGQETFNADQVLNLRQKLDALVDWKTDVTPKGQALVKDLRRIVDKHAKKNITGLSSVDEEFGAVAEQFKKLRKDYFDKNGNLKDNAISKISNLTNKGREQILGRIEKVSPGISDKIRVVKAMEDIESAMGNKIGTYARSAFGGSGVIATALNPFIGIPMLIGGFLTNPKIASNLIKKYAKKYPLKRVTSIIDKVSDMKNLSKIDSEIITDVVKMLPEGKIETLAGKAFKENLQMNVQAGNKMLPMPKRIMQSGDTNAIRLRDNILDEPMAKVVGTTDSLTPPKEKSIVSKTNKQKIVDNIETKKATAKQTVVDNIANKQKAKNLSTEAKKYKSADEFIDSKETVYHGGNIENIEDIQNAFDGSRTTERGDPISMLGVNFSDKNTAKYFSERGGGKMLEVKFTPKKTKTFKSYSSTLNELSNYSPSELFINESKRIRDINKKSEYFIDNQFDSTWIQEFKDDLIGKGYDSIKFKNELDGGITIIPLNKDAISTTGQLTDIFNKANN